MCSVHVRYTVDKSRRRAGFSLIEVVVAIAILSGMLLLGGMALNQGLRQYQGLTERGLRFWDHAQRIWTDKCFHSIMDYYVHTDAEGWFPYFHGAVDRISFVTAAAFTGDLPVVVWIMKEKSDSGKMRLAYYELPVVAKSYRNILDDYLSGAYRKGASVSILDEAEDIRFQYFGYSVRDEKRVWRPGFDGADTRQIPELVRIDYVQDGRQKMFLFAVHVNCQMKRGYENIYSQ